MIEILCKYISSFFHFIFLSDRLFFLSSVPNWKDVSSNNTNLGKKQLSLTVKNSLDTINTKPMTYSCFNTTVNFSK
jgi:hypothetical protein